MFFGGGFVFFRLHCLMNFPRGVSPTAVVDQGFVPGADQGKTLDAIQRSVIWFSLFHLLFFGLGFIFFFYLFLSFFLIFYIIFFSLFVIYLESSILFMNYESILQYIYSLQKFGKKSGLKRITKLMHSLGDPQQNLPIIHIAGTNGKGSTTAMTANILKHAGYKVGMFISPFIIDFRERIQINGDMISKDTFIKIAERVKVQVDLMCNDGECPSFFEVVTAIALCYFDMEKCDIVCLEVGLGGRFDATNVISKSLVSVITSISLDHTELLGDTVADIAFEKCGILKENGICVSYPLQESSALDVIKEQSDVKKNKLVVADMGNVEWISRKYSSIIRYKGLDMELPLPGKHQVANAVTVLCIMEQLRNQGKKVPDDAIIKGIETVKFPARLELVSRNPDVIIDGAHNIAGAYSLSDFIKNHPASPKILLFGILKDKKYKDVIDILMPQADAVVLTTPKIDRAIRSGDVYNLAKIYCDNVICEDDYQKAIRFASDIAGRNGVVFICGSLYLASDMRRILLNPTLSTSNGNKSQ